jgi:fatty-acid desaturase
MATAANPERKYVPHKIPHPPTLERKLIWPYFIAFLFYHAMAVLALVPWLFSWTGLALWLLGFYVFGTLGINLCYHRLLTHRSFNCPKWLEHVFAIIGVCCLQDTPARWVAVHRLHHQHSDEPSDPHSPLAGFFWGHMFWLIRSNKELERMQLYEHYAKDILRDRFYFKLERNLMWVWVNLIQWFVFYVVGFGIGYVAGDSWLDGMQFGLSLLVWGVFLRTVSVWHITWSVNSVAHIWGYRNYETDENSRNNVLVGIWSNGEGWHNNHHAQPRSAAHGHKWWELDVTWITIWALKQVGLARDVVPINKKMAERQTVKEY